MALFDLNSRYTKSMENGGSYERDASIGGYNRKELRGLSKQARRGTLTQRERARLKYLTDERGGRRKRGLLSGLGGAAATLGALAAAGKLGEGEGGEGRGAALMDAIKLRLAEGKEKRMRRRVDPMEEVSSLETPKNVREEKGLMGGERTAESPAPMSLKDLDEATPAADLIKRIQTGANVDDVLEKIEQDDVRQRVSEAGAPAQDFSGELSEDVGEGTLSSLRDNYNMMMADEAKKEEEERQLTRLFGLNPEMPEGPVARGGMSPMFPGPETTDLPQRLMRLARAEDDASMVSSENPFPTGITSTRRNTGPEVDLGSMLTQAELDAENVLPGRIGEQPTRGSNRPNVSQLFKALNRSKPSEINVDPEGIASDQYPGAAQTLLNAYNEKRRELGLEPVIQLTKEMIEETEGAMDPRDRATPQLMTRRPARQILNRYN